MTQKTPIKLKLFRLYPYSTKPVYDLKEPLSFLSLDRHDYFQGSTRVRATFTLEAPAGSKVTQVELLFFKGRIPMGAVLRRGYPLTPANWAPVVTKNGKLEITSSNHIAFAIPMAGVDPDVFEDDTEITATLIVTTSNGAAEQVLAVRLKPLIRINNTLRYSGRDRDDGGDDWVIPSLKPTIEYLAKTYNVYINDISKMNGGTFPPHKTHKRGLEVDARTTLNRTDFKIDAKLADTLIELLGDPDCGPRIREVLITFDRSSTPEFFDRMNRSTVRGTKALHYLRNVSGHSDHFHLIFNK